MTIRTGSNTLSLNAQRRLADTTASLAATYERLSSGQRINKASDDAAGLSIASSLQTDSRVFTQAIRNVSDGLSLLNIGDAAVGELSSIVIRIRELSEQSANGTYTATQRGAMDDEAQALSKEFFRISRSANFNGLRLFDGSLEGGIRLQAGYGVEGSIQSTFGRGLGTGTFGGQAVYATETSQSGFGMGYAVRLGDLNGDGVVDLVSTGYTYDGARRRGQATVLLGRGDGSFGAEVTYVTPAVSGDNRSFALEIGDLNSDGIVDVVTAGSGWDGARTQGEAVVLLGRGDGSFGGATTYSTETATVGSSHSQGVALGDVNGDGILDLVTAGQAFDGAQLSGRATVMLGRGDGTFGGKNSYATHLGSGQSGTLELRLGDVNRDGILDLAAAGYVFDGVRNQGQLVVILGRGDGTFGNKTTYATETAGSGSNYSHNLALADLNADGILDLMSAGSVHDGARQQGQVTVLIGRGDGTFASKATYATETSGSGAMNGSYAVRAGDVNGDGILDLVTAGYAHDGIRNQGQATVMLGRGDGSFAGKITYATQTAGSGQNRSYGADVGDVNGDGVLDLVAVGVAHDGTRHQGQVSVLTAATREGIAPILPFSLRSMADARQAMSMLDRKLDSLSAQRGVIGAFQSRLEVATNTLAVSRENFQAAGGRIKDTDVAAESSNLVRTQILQQAASAVLGQANQQPALAIQLLGA